MFRTAAAYHAALAAYARALRHGGDVEDLAQQVIGSGIAYRVALDRLIASEPADSRFRRRAQTLRELLHHTSAQYNRAKRDSPLVALPPD